MRILKSFSVYVFTMFFNAGVSFATFSLLTRYLSEVDYGIISLYSSISILLVAFIGSGVQFVLNVDYFSLRAERYKMQFSNGIVIPVAIALFLTLIFLAFNRSLQPFIKSNFFFIVVLPFSCLLTLFNDITLNLIRNKEKHFLFARYSISKNLVEISLVIFFIVGLGWNWQGRLSGALIALACAIAFSFYLFRKWDLLTKKIDTGRIKGIFREGMPFIPERLAVFFMMYSDRFFIDHFEGVGDVGYYSAGAQIAVILNLICHSLNSTFYPYFYKRLGKDQLDYQGLRKGIFAFTGISAATMILLFAATPFVFKYFVGSTFSPGEKYAYYLIVAFFFWAIYNMLLPFLLIRKKNRMVMSVSIVGMMLSIGLNFYNVRHFGALGATYTSIAVFFTMCLLTLYFVHRHYNLKLLFWGK